MTPAGEDLKVTNRLVAHEITLPVGWSGCEFPLGFPLKDEGGRAEMMRVLWDISERLFAVGDAQPTVWLLMDNLHKDGAVLNLSRNAREWKPRYGLGLWPDQPPPRMTTPNDILDMEWGARPRRPYHRVTWLAASGTVLRSAWTTMFGLGSTTLTLAQGGGEQITRQTRESLREPITDESFREFPFYFPLIGKQASGQATALQLDRWLGPVVLYLRESEEDNSLLLLVRVPPRVLRDALHAAAIRIAELQAPAKITGEL